MLNKILITGGTGFLGRELIKRLYKDSEITVVARNEGKLIELKELFPDIKIITGDISDPFVAEKACKDMNGIYHLAAFKHVGMAEEQVRECVLSNVVGTINILNMSLKYKPDFVLGISTDKAAQVAGIYGATKLIMEGLFKDYEGVNSDTKYRIVRYGNVMFSTGSVLCKWRDRMKNNEQVIITDGDATRFYWTVQQAIDHVFECMKNSTDCTPYIPSMKAMTIHDLFTAMGTVYYKGSDSMKIKTIGLQQGENKHERLVKDGPSSNDVERYTIEEIIALIMEAQEL